MKIKRVERKRIAIPIIVSAILAITTVLYFSFLVRVGFHGTNLVRGFSAASPENISTQLVISPSTFELESEQTITLTATLRTVDNVPLSGKTISWSAQYGMVSPRSGITDSNGKVSVTYTAPTTDYRLRDNIIAQFASDNQYTGSVGQSIGRITVPDSDNDYMPDKWEDKYGLNPKNRDDADQDMDGDGYTNIQEYWVMTDPTSASSYPGAGEGAPSTEGIFLVVVGALIAAASIASVVFIGTLRTRGEAVSILLENGLLNMRVKEVDMFRRIRELKEFTIPELMRETSVSKLFAWRTLQKLIKKGLVRPTKQQRAASSNGEGGRGKPSTIYKYVGS